MVPKRERKRRDGSRYVVWRVRWHDATGQERNRTFDTKGDAEAFEAMVRLVKRAGDLPTLDAGRQTLAEFAEEWWELYARANLAESTRRNYAAVWNKRALPRLGALRMRDFSPTVIVRFRADLEHDGGGAPTVRKTMVTPQSTLRDAVAWERLSSNPVQAVRKPATPRERAARYAKTP